MVQWSGASRARYSIGVQSKGVGVSLEAPSNAVVSKRYNAMIKASTGGHTGPSTPRGLCVMEMGRGAVERRLTRPIFNWSAAEIGRQTVRR